MQAMRPPSNTTIVPNNANSCLEIHLNGTSRLPRASHFENICDTGINVHWRNDYSSGTHCNKTKYSNTPCLVFIEANGVVSATRDSIKGLVTTNVCRGTHAGGPWAYTKESPEGKYRCRHSHKVLETNDYQAALDQGAGNERLPGRFRRFGQESSAKTSETGRRTETASCGGQTFGRRTETAKPQKPNDWKKNGLPRPSGSERNKNGTPDSKRRTTDSMRNGRNG